ncbi:MAG: response regulator transcription factor, partial [Chloroflexi bacterium]|nr:response regulator transcription factor [Chloroflexota bacterium]
DEEALRFFAAEGLTQAGWSVDEASSGEAALAVVAETSYDVILLDLRMVGIDGLTVMRQIKERWPETMVIIMTAYASLDSAIEAVRQGAFDYLQKPCLASDIVACANRALAKKETLAQQRQLAQSIETKLPSAGEAAPANVIRSGSLVIEFGSHAVSLAGQRLSLTPTEYTLLEILARCPGQSISVKQLILDGLGYDPSDAQAQETLRVHISRLRRKLGSDYILTARGGGYALANIPPLS